MIQNAIENYHGAWSFQKHNEDPAGFKSREIMYSSAFVDVLILRNPNKCVRSSYKDRQARNQRSYARVFVSGREKQYIESFLKMLANRLPGVNKRCKHHNITKVHSGRHCKYVPQEDSIDALV